MPHKRQLLGIPVSQTLCSNIFSDKSNYKEIRPFPGAHSPTQGARASVLLEYSALLFLPHNCLPAPSAQKSNFLEFYTQLNKKRN